MEELEVRGHHEEEDSVLLVSEVWLAREEVSYCLAVRCWICLGTQRPQRALYLPCGPLAVAFVLECLPSPCPKPGLATFSFQLCSAKGPGPCGCFFCHLWLVVGTMWL